jgi:hypothetical protein
MECFVHKKLSDISRVCKTMRRPIPPDVLWDVPSNVPSSRLTVLGGVWGWGADPLGRVHDKPRQQPAPGGLWEQPASGGHPV